MTTLNNYDITRARNDASHPSSRIVPAPIAI